LTHAPTGGTGLAAGIFVFGMHRSGTSCLTALLEAGGARLGHVLRRNASNPHGTYERSDVQALNDALLARAAASWRDPAVVDTAGAEERAGLRAVLASLEGRGPWAIKDPRFVFTLGAWRALAEDARVVACLRHPLAVADSLERREGMAAQESCRLWTRYNERLLEWVEAEGLPVVCFDEEPAVYLEQVAALFERLGLRYDESLARRVYRPGPHLQREGLGDVDSGCLDLYEVLRGHSLAASRAKRKAPAAPPRISVIIPTCDPARAPLLAEAVSSVLVQPDDLELLVIADGPAALADEPGWMQDPRVRVHRQGRAGSAAARNSGVWLARGEYLAFLDDDDLFCPDRFAHQLARLEGDPRLALAYARAERIGEGAPRTWPSVVREGDIFEDLFFENFIPIQTVLARRSALVAEGGFDEGIELTDDWDLWLRVAARHPVASSEALLAIHRRHADNASRDRTRIQLAELATLHACRRRDSARFAKLGGRARRELGRRHLRLARRLQAEGRSREAHHHFGQSLRFAPAPKATLNWLRTWRR